MYQGIDYLVCRCLCHVWRSTICHDQFGKLKGEDTKVFRVKKPDFTYLILVLRYKTFEG